MTKPQMTIPKHNPKSVEKTKENHHSTEVGTHVAEPTCEARRVEAPIAEETPMSERDLRRTFDRAVGEHRPELYAAALRLTRSDAEAEDVLQDALARAWRYWARFEQGTNSRAWMHRILFNTFINRYRKRRREREILDQVRAEGVTQHHWGHPVSLPSKGLEIADAHQGLDDEVRAALVELAPTFRDAVEQVDLHGRSYKEAAKLLGCPVGTVMSRLHRGRRFLKDRLRAYAISEGYLAAA